MQMCKMYRDDQVVVKVGDHVRLRFACKASSLPVFVSHIPACSCPIWDHQRNCTN